MCVYIYREIFKSPVGYGDGSLCHGRTLILRQHSYCYVFVTVDPSVWPQLGWSYIMNYEFGGVKNKRKRIQKRARQTGSAFQSRACVLHQLFVQRLSLLYHAVVMCWLDTVAVDIVLFRQVCACVSALFVRFSKPLSPSVAFLIHLSSFSQSVPWWEQSFWQVWMGICVNVAVSMCECEFWCRGCVISVIVSLWAGLPG